MDFFRSKTEFLWTVLRNCPLCGATWPPKNWLCLDCEQQLYRMFLEPEAMSWTEERRLKVYSLLDWQRGETSDQFLSRLIYSLKGGELKKAWRGLALEFLSRWQRQAQQGSYRSGELLGQNILLIPAPPAQKGDKDHALEFSRALGDLLDAPVWRGLRRTHPTGKGWVQKRLGRFQRGQLQLERDPGRCFPSQLEGRWFVFVDDLITSGSTARAARAALSGLKKQDFLCWTLLRRSLPEKPTT